tara:strand:+ start:1829 stop:2554 length:726 start_codon:yes stop_codon:yes gene_type:complete
MKINSKYSPNFNKKKRPSNSIKVIVIHYTGMQSERESIMRLCDPKSKVSSHYLINKKGKTYRLVEDNKVAWHAGISSWGKYKNLNQKSIGIELTNKGHKFGYAAYTKKQTLSLVKLCKFLKRKYKIKDNNFVGHSDIAPLRKIDPGEKFPWKELANNKIGIWHNIPLTFLKKFRKTKLDKKIDKINFVKYLTKVGYYLPKNKEIFFVKTVKAFQRHYRKELINGILDKECLIIAKNLSKKA